VVAEAVAKCLRFFGGGKRGRPRRGGSRGSVRYASPSSSQLPLATGRRGGKRGRPRRAATAAVSTPSSSAVSAVVAMAAAAVVVVAVTASSASASK
jgi:hypothetical protein